MPLLAEVLGVTTPRAMVSKAERAEIHARVVDDGEAQE
jgi:hypothetical protein